ncbi:hypothetical protein [Bacillus wiedmannii]|uniref:hypothetical protein n=1 Tax=Bacillus wiedmannii TaxID=1890302 RepID=UPI00159EE8F3|nr:hypothetical protein [Bacillus wiedmannii]
MDTVLKILSKMSSKSHFTMLIVGEREIKIRLFLQQLLKDAEEKQFDEVWDGKLMD